MKTSLSWIKAYVPDLEVRPGEFTDRMTLSGSKVEGCESLDKDLEKILVGRIEKIEKHPNADKLMVCQVDLGDRMIQIVTGAQNIKEGDKVPVVLEGGRVAGGHAPGQKVDGGIKIQKGKLRGVESFGMMCSIEELGSTREMFPEAPEDGIYIFPEETRTGADAVELLGLKDTVFEFEITSNRVDCYSVVGLAREAAATFQKNFHPPVIKAAGNEEKVEDYIKVSVKDEELCPRFCARVAKNIKIAPSPQWLQRRLKSVGIRPINNLVDITNYVMEEYGQPMHAYDLETIQEREIIVKRAKAGETFVTLDGQKRLLDDSVLMICDGKKSIGIAGIMGGENSMITDNVKTVLFEAATFHGPNIRKSSKKVGLRTDASGKFEKGLEISSALLAVNRACQLVEELGAGEVVGGVLDVCAGKSACKKIKFEPEKINSLLGTSISPEDMLSYLKRLEILREESENVLIIPAFRQDLDCCGDIAEEVARFYGYDKIPSTLPGGETTLGKTSLKRIIEGKAHYVAKCCGFSQGMVYSFESPKVFDKLLIHPDSPLRKTVEIRNPLGEDYSVMRTLSVNGMLESLSRNYNRRNKNVKLYEMGNIYIPDALPVTTLPEERMQWTLGMFGEGDFFTLKGVLEEFFESIGMKDKRSYRPSKETPFLHPGRQADIFYKECRLGYIGEVHPQVTEQYDIGDRVYLAVVDMPEAEKMASFDTKYAGIARFPSVTRDISMLVPADLQAGQIEDVIDKKGGAYLESCRLFDVYEGSQIKEGFRSLAYSVVFRAREKTLTDAEVTEAMERIVKALEALGAELRK